MEVTATSSFTKDLAKLKDGKIARKIEAVIYKMQTCKSLFKFESN